MGRGTQEGQKDDSGAQGGAITLNRGLTVLSAFTREQPDLSLIELAERTGINKPTLLRFLSSLQSVNLVSQNEAGLYHIGSFALTLAGLYHASVSEDDLILSALTNLASTTGESASFSILEGKNRVVAYRVPSKHRIRDNVEVGDTFPLGIGAPGRVLQAFTSDASTPLLDAIRTDMFALSKDEVELGAAAVAVPVFKGRKIEAALAVTGPTSRINDERTPEIALLLLAQARELTRRMGGDYTIIQTAISRLENAQTVKIE